MSEKIVRIAARGDGVTSEGRFVRFGVPGDIVEDDGTLVEGPGHQQPPCQLFPDCGGCQLQHLTDAAYADYCSGRIAGALAQHGLKSKILPPHLSPPRSRRRASLRFVRTSGRVLLGFNAERSNRVVDMVECHVLTPALFDLLAPLRDLLASLDGRAGEVQLTQADQGVDVAIKGVEADGLEAIEALSNFGIANRLARLSLDEGFGAEPHYEPQRVTVTLGGRPVPLPVGAFLQATADGESALVAAVGEAIAGAERALDLFAGLGTFALALPGRVAAAEASRDAVESLRRATSRIEVQHRDLYRRPYEESELARHDAVVLDPPRAGAEEQVRKLAASVVPRIAYVSCNPATFARDAAILVSGGYRIGWVKPVGQFRWSTHVELAAAFVR